MSTLTTVAVSAGTSALFSTGITLATANLRIRRDEGARRRDELRQKFRNMKRDLVTYIHSLYHGRSEPPSKIDWHSESYRWATRLISAADEAGWRKRTSTRRLCTRLFGSTITRIAVDIPLTDSQHTDHTDPFGEGAVALIAVMLEQWHEYERGTKVAPGSLSDGTFTEYVAALRESRTTTDDHTQTRLADLRDRTLKELRKL